MKHKLFILISLIFCSFATYAQTNTIKIDAALNTNTDVIQIQQEIVFYNNTNKILSQIYLHNWQNGFKNRKTPLSKRLIEDYRKSLYFANDNERGFTEILNLTANYKSINFSSKKDQGDIIKLDLNKSLNPNDSIIINATYTVKIPNAKFTGYGKTTTGYHLRYWYLTPAVYTKKWQLMSNVNIDDLLMDASHYEIKFKTPKNSFISSNLAKTIKTDSSILFKGKHRTDVLININKNEIFTTYKTKHHHIITDIPFKELNPTLVTLSLIHISEPTRPY